MVTRYAEPNQINRESEVSRESRQKRTNDLIVLHPLAILVLVFSFLVRKILFGEYVVRSFLPNGVFLYCDHGLDF